MLPQCSGPHATLPAGIHRAKLGEIYERFVSAAPSETQHRRQMIFAGASLHIERVRLAFKGTRIRVWLDGGFVTHKSQRPNDADLAFLVPAGVIARASHDRAIPLWTLADVSATIGANGPQVVTPKLHTCLGLTDAYVVNADNPYAVEMKRREWARVKDPSDPAGRIIEGEEKGFVKVITDDES